MKRIVLLTLACAAAGSMFGVDIYIWPLDLAPEDKRPSYYVLVSAERFMYNGRFDVDRIPSRDTFDEVRSRDMFGAVHRIPLLLPSPKMFKESAGDDVCKDYSRVVTKNEIEVPEWGGISGRLGIIFNDKGKTLYYFDSDNAEPIWCMLAKSSVGAGVKFYRGDDDAVLSNYFDSYYYDLGQKCLEVRGKNKAQALAIRAKWKLSSISLDSILKKARKAGQEVKIASAEGLSVLKDIAIIVPLSAVWAASFAVAATVAVPATVLGFGDQSSGGRSSTPYSFGERLGMNFFGTLYGTAYTIGDVATFTVDLSRVAAAAAKEKLSAAKEKLSGAVDTAKEKLSGAADAAKEKLSGAKEKLGDAADAAKAKLSGAADAAKEKFASLKERLKK